jgi:hypothetical protein
VWVKVAEYSDWPVFMKLMEDLCLARIRCLKERPAPNMNTWSFSHPDVTNLALRKFLISEEETKEFKGDYNWDTSDIKSNLRQQEGFSVIFELTRPKLLGWKLKITKTKEFFSKKLAAFSELQETVLDLEERIRKLK